MMVRTIVPVLLVLASGASLAAAETEPPSDAVIRLERTRCYGPCPIYSVTIDARGTVIYNGVLNVRVIGERTGRVDLSVVSMLLATADRIHFFEMRDRYYAIENPDGTIITVTDLPTTFVTITANGRTKRVEDYVGAPDALADLELAIDNAAGSRRWIFIDSGELEGLVRSGWLASSDHGAKLLQEAIGRDDLPIARRLIELGADLNGPPEDPRPPLYVARSSRMVDLLVAAGANPNERTRYGAQTPLLATAHKDAAVAEALLRVGARLEDVENVRNGRTALFYAACAGNWRVVTVFLRAGANPRGATDKISALDCTRERRESALRRPRTVLDRNDPTVADFDRVIQLLEEAERRMKR